MIQDIKPLFLDNHFHSEERVNSDSSIIIIRENSFLIKEDSFKRKGLIEFPKGSDFIPGDGFVYIFSIGDERFFLSTDGSMEYQLPGYAYTQLSSIRGKELLPKHRVFAAFTAYHLSSWYSSTVFCGKCGSRNVNDTKERARRCPACGNMTYPRINPAVIIAVTDKETGKIVLTKYNRGFAHYALVAGFTEIGETLEQTVEREVMEEVGLKVTNIRYYKSQPWGVASDILMGYFCDVDGDTEIHMDNEELKLAGWYAPSEIELQPMPYSLTNEMMALFKEKGYEGTINFHGQK